MSQDDVASGVEQRRRLIVELLRTEIVTSVNELAKLIERAGQSAPSHQTLRTDLERIGVVRVNLGNNVWRYRTADLVTIDDVSMGVQDRLHSDGISAVPWGTDAIIIRTTKGTAAALGGLLKMLIDYELDASIRFVLHDSDDTVLMCVSPPESRGAYLKRVKTWMGSR
jgi:arginine repressor